MPNNNNNLESTVAIRIVKPGATYLHTLALRQWIIRKERSFNTQEWEKVKLLNQQLVV